MTTTALFPHAVNKVPLRKFGGAERRGMGEGGWFSSRQYTWHHQTNIPPRSDSMSSWHKHKHAIRSPSLGSQEWYRVTHSNLLQQPFRELQQFKVLLMKHKTVHPTCLISLYHIFHLLHYAFSFTLACTNMNLSIHCLFSHSLPIPAFVSCLQLHYVLLSFVWKLESTGWEQWLPTNWQIVQICKCQWDMRTDIQWHTRKTHSHAHQPVLHHSRPYQFYHISWTM